MTPSLKWYVDAVKAEAAPHSTLLPRRTIDRVARDSPERLAEYFRAIPLEWDSDAPQTIWAPKSFSTYRPLHLTTLQQRTRLQALTRQLRQRLSASRSIGHHSAAIQGPLQGDAQHSHVLSIDVAAFYQYIDHDRLERTLVRSTGDGIAPKEISDTLLILMGQRFGLPQLCESSDWLSEVYIQPVHRNLLRTGLKLWRYNDDFRVAVDSQSEGQSVLLTVIEELYNIGLVVNESKTFIQTRAEYEEWTNGHARRWQELLNDAEFSRLVDLSYQGWVEPDEAEGSLPDEEERDLLEVCEGVLVRWAASTGPNPVPAEIWEANLDETLPPPPVMKRMLARTLALLSNFGNPVAVPYLPQVITWAPELTRNVSDYLVALTRGNDGDAASRTIHNIDNPLSLSPWQSTWLLQPYLHGAQVTPEASSWINSLVGDRVSIVAATALRAMAATGNDVADAVGSVFERLDEDGRCEALRALADAHGAEALIRDFAHFTRQNVATEATSDWLRKVSTALPPDG